MTLNRNSTESKKWPHFDKNRRPRSQKYALGHHADNGKEFAFHEEMTEALSAPVYFADPYSSWQRGLNENTNGLLRQYWPKITDFKKVSADETTSYCSVRAV
jgi:IS30 family transposase